jgi:RimJ/RimL family protein N-acetyltransferase
MNDSGLRLLDAIATDRLMMRPLERGDGLGLFRVMGNDAAMTWDHSLRGEERIGRDLEGRLRHYREHGFGVYGVWLGAVLVGQCGLQVLQGNEAAIEAVVYVGREYWRRGIAAEACTGALRYGFEVRKFPEIYWVTRLENTAARALARELGFVRVREDVVYEAQVEVSVLRLAEFRPRVGRFVVTEYRWRST